MVQLYLHVGKHKYYRLATLGAIGEHQKIDGLGLEDQKRFMHHYNFPPYSVGEVGRMGAPGRREIGHGALGERALAQVIPGEDEFPIYNSCCFRSLRIKWFFFTSIYLCFINGINGSWCTN
ncbi:MAG: hypothetical protein ACLTAI_06530 [Thomasclavelia sp.]